MASAATVAARSSRCTSAAVRGRSGEKAPSRPWSEEPATILTKARVLRGGVGVARARPARSRRRAGPVRSKQSRARARSTSASAPADGEHPAVGGRDHGRALEEAGHRRRRARRASPGEHDPHEHAVHLVLALEQGRLLLDDLLEGSDAGRRVARAAPAEVDGRRGPRLAGGWQGLCVPGLIVGNNDHPVTVDPSIASPHAPRPPLRRDPRCPRPSRRSWPRSCRARRSTRRSSPRTGTRCTSPWAGRCCPSSPRMPCRCRPPSASPWRPEPWRGASPGAAGRGPGVWPRVTSCGSVAAASRCRVSTSWRRAPGAPPASAASTAPESGARTGRQGNHLGTQPS